MSGTNEMIFPLCTVSRQDIGDQDSPQYSVFLPLLVNCEFSLSLLIPVLLNIYSILLDSLCLTFLGQTDFIAYCQCQSFQACFPHNMTEEF